MIYTSNHSDKPFCGVAFAKDAYENDEIATIHAVMIKTVLHSVFVGSSPITGVTIYGAITPDILIKNNIIFKKRYVM